MSERYYKDIAVVAETEDVALVNHMLTQGAELLAIKERTKQTIQEGQKVVIEIVPVYILGRPKDVEIRDEPEPQPQKEEKKEKIEKIDLAKLPWQQSKFSEDVDSVPPDKIPQEAKDFMLKHNSKVEDEKYVYILAKSGWMNRRKKGKAKISGPATHVL